MWKLSFNKHLSLQPAQQFLKQLMYIFGYKAQVESKDKRKTCKCADVDLNKLDTESVACDTRGQRTRS